MPGIFVNQDWHGLHTHIKEGMNAYFKSKRKNKKASDWRKNPNYRAIYIIDEYRSR